MATIVVLEHELQQHVDLPYMVRRFAEVWRESGHRVLLHRGLDSPPPADVAILHVDLTVVPEAYRELVARYERVVNGAVFDVSKSRFSQDLVYPDSDWAGPVIVKTEANYGGKPEQLWRSIAAQLGRTTDIAPGPLAEAYPVYDSMRQVPQIVWRTPGLIVERFLPERDERGYYVRIWSFFGDRELSTRWLAPDRIVKSANRIGRDSVDVPDEIRAWRQRLGFDFGKFDYVRHGDRWVLLDVNRTPSAPSLARGSARMATLAAGLGCFLREPSRL